MSSIPNLVWSSRESIHAQLLSILHTIPVESVELRCRAVRLLGIFGGQELSSPLRTLVFDSREDLRTRAKALQVVVKHGLSLSGSEMTELIEHLLDLMCPCCRPSLECVLTLARTEESCAAAETALEKVSPWERASLLASASRTSLPPWLVEWLFARWYTDDRHQLMKEEEPWRRETNLMVAVAHRERPEAGKHLDAWARDLAPEELEPLESWGLSPEEVACLVRVAPRLQQRAAELLLLPLPELLACVGQEALLRRIQRIVRDESVAERVSYRIKPSPPGYSRAVELLVQWREARPRLCSLLCDFDLAEGVRRALLDRLFDHDRALTLRWTLVATRYPDNTPLVRFVLQRAASRPEPEDRPLLLAALRGTDDEARAFALEGLLALGESGVGWRDRLTSLVHASHARVRLGAAACLVREGLHEWIPLLRRTALEAPEPGLRAEAVRWLGLVDAEASRPVLRKMLFEEESSPLRRPAPAADEAARALARLGTTEDLSALADAVLRGCCSQFLDRELEHHLSLRACSGTGAGPAPAWG